MKIEFVEEQRFRAKWLWLLLGGLAMLTMYALYQQVVLEMPFGTNPMSDWGLLIMFIVVFGVIGMFWFTRLKTEIDQTEIRIRFSPLGNRTIQWIDVKSAEVVDYGFVGWGLRMSIKHGTVYNTQGRIGLAIVLKNGNKFLVGTQREQELKKVVQRLTN